MGREQRVAVVQLSRKAVGDRIVQDLSLSWTVAAAIGRQAPTLSALIEAAVSEHGRVDLVVVDVGATSDPRPVLATSSDDVFDAVADLGYLVAGLQCALDVMSLNAPGGRAIILMSANAKAATLAQSMLAMVEHGVAGFIKVASREVGPSGITLNAVLVDWEDDVRNSPQFSSLTGTRTTPAQVSAAVELLASDVGGGITGTFLPFDGGRTPY